MYQIIQLSIQVISFGSQVRHRNSMSMFEAGTKSTCCLCMLKWPAGPPQLVRAPTFCSASLSNFALSFCKIRMEPWLQKQLKATGPDDTQSETKSEHVQTIFFLSCFLCYAATSPTRLQGPQLCHPALAKQPVSAGKVFPSKYLWVWAKYAVLGWSLAGIFVSMNVYMQNWERSLGLMKAR